MNSVLKTSILTTAAIVICSFTTLFIGQNAIKAPMPIVVYVEEYKALTEWQTFMLALAEVESENDPKAKGDGNYIGLFQIAPIYVNEANNIKGEKYFKLNDRYNPKKSIEMFLTINDFHNQEQDIDKAIKLHNPTASSAYKKKILNKIDEINKREAIREHCITAMNYATR